MVLEVKKFLIENLIFRSPLFDLIKPNLFTNQLILMYHGVDTAGNTSFNQRHTRIEDFEKQIIFLKKKCNILTIQDFFEEKFNRNKINVAITFDDGYFNNYSNAFPILEKYQVPATFYCTGLNNTEDDILWADFLNIASTLTDKKLEIEGEVFIKKGKLYYSNSSGKNIYETVKNINPEYAFKKKIFEALSDLKFKILFLRKQFK